MTSRRLCSALFGASRFAGSSHSRIRTASSHITFSSNFHNTASPYRMADGKDTARKDWSANQYLKFEKQRTRPARDLLAQVPLDQPPRRVLDVGCGPGNSTEILREQYPAAAIEGIDSSPDMIAKAGKRLPDIPFSVVDLRTYSPKEPQDLIFSNAVLHWLRADERIPTLRRMVEWLRPGGVLAIQVPDNYLEKSHAAMRAVAEEGPWAPVLGPLKPALDPFDSPQALYDGLAPLCSAVDIWHTLYQHPLEDHQGVVEWVKGTGLRPFLDPLGPEDRVAFEKEYLEKLKGLYPVSVDGKVLLRYPRLFLVAVRA